MSWSCTCFVASHSILKHLYSYVFLLWSFNIQVSLTFIRSSVPPQAIPPCSSAAASPALEHPHLPQSFANALTVGLVLLLSMGCFAWKGHRLVSTWFQFGQLTVVAKRWDLKTGAEDLRGSRTSVGSSASQVSFSLMRSASFWSWDLRVWPVPYGWKMGAGKIPGFSQWDLEGHSIWVCGPLVSGTVLRQLDTSLLVELELFQQENERVSLRLKETTWQCWRDS